MDSLMEIVSFMKMDARLDLKAVSVSNVLSLTGTADGRKLLYKCPEVIISLFRLTASNTETIAKDALLAIVNLSAEPDGATLLLDVATNLIEISIKLIMDENCALADAWTMVLSNISRPENLVEKVIDDLQNIDSCLEKLVSCFTRIGYNKKKCNLHYLGPIFSNLSQSYKGREIMCRPETQLLQRILPFVHHDGSTVRRGGAIGLLKNVCFDSAKHDWLLGSDVNVLPYILLPLAGPEEFDDNINEMLPIELQYLEPEKKREADPDLRKMLLESLAQLCATRKARDYLRSKGTYEILRELHKWECTDQGDKMVVLACENVVDILIRTEEEIGEDNLKSIDIPNDLADKFDKLDKTLMD